ncbi:MAG: Rrf2 family transcriptional regulator, partial [Pseudomonadota bacterium]|nr:Rrf2 family transcriptional regulator [Pseudomonadota bacterium]
MKLQKATQFGLYAVLELAREPDRQLSALDIAETYGISSHHLAKVLRDLVRAGLVESVRGAGGGYKFCGNSRRTTLMDIIHIFEEIGSDTIFSGREIENTDIGSALQ